MLIETKLHPPELRCNLVDRPDLQCQLEQVMKAKLTIVSAAAGFGKSTLLSQWAARLRQSGVRWGWLSLDTGDNELSRFMDYLVAALQRAEASIAQDVPALLKSSPVLPTDSVMTTIINDLSRSSHDIVLVLDDCHLLTSPEIRRFLDALLTYAPPAFHLVLATRGESPVKAASMRVRGQMVWIDDTRLRFSIAETRAFLTDLRGLELSASDVASLQHRTEGWIAALQLAALSLENRADKAGFISSFSGTDRDIADFLVQDVLGRLPARIIDFLLQTSVLDRISAPLAESVTGNSDAAALLAEIEQSNLFVIRLDQSRTWYRYHHLFQDLLQSLLKQRQPALLPGLHLKAARWLTDNGLTTDAVQHALAAGDSALAVSLVEACCMPLIRDGHIIRVSAWLNSLPEEVVNGHPRLQLAKVWVLFHMSRAVPAAAVLKAARDNIAGAEREGRLGAREQMELRSELKALTAGVISAADRSRTAARLAQEWLARFPEGQHFSRGTLGNVLGFCLYSLGELDGARHACLRARDSHALAASVFGIVYSDLILGLAEHAAGRLVAAHELFSRAIRLAREALGPGSYAEAMVGIFVVELLYEWDDIANAERLLQEHRQIIEECGLVVHEMACKLNVARLAACRGRSEEALIVLESAERQGLATRYRRLFAAALHERVRLLLVRGDTASARLALRDHGIHESWLASPRAAHPACEPEHLALARVLCSEGRPEAALRILDPLAERLRRNGRLHRFAQVRAVTAVAAHQAGDALSALAAVVDAVSLCAPQKAVRTLLDEGAPFLDVVAFGRDRIPSWKTGGEAGRFVDLLLSGRVRLTRGDAAAPALSQFSQRETELARLLSTGQSNRELASELRMAPDTVKWHLKNIFGKLGVANRTQAVIRLQELGLARDRRPPGRVV
ncbi:LuxR C-terminal-related transcriptional regulator [Aestuariivirga sp.]|uniref:LuxR C-terminal-related transcriptional regulator n=1 Tax=Aestuariivirga sp. TaxID=2650926 RepID=UPI00391A207C